MAECRSRRQEAAVSASMRMQIEAARLQKAEGRTLTVSAASSRLIESLQAARGKRRRSSYEQAARTARHQKAECRRRRSGECI